LISSHETLVHFKKNESVFKNTFGLGLKKKEGRTCFESVRECYRERERARARERERERPSCLAVPSNLSSAPWRRTRGACSDKYSTHKKVNNDSLGDVRLQRLRSFSWIREGYEEETQSDRCTPVKTTGS